MKILFWISLLGILYTYAGYPLVIWALARLRPRPWKVGPITPSVSIILPVHNGVELLPRKIEHLLALDYRNVKEVIIVSDGSTDGTMELLAKIQHPLLKTITLREHAGKAVALNAGVSIATGEVILFVDIRPEIAPGSIQKLVNNFADPTVGCVAGELVLRQEGADLTAAAVGGFYWRHEQWIRKCESAVDSPVGVYGGFYAIRRELAELQPAGMILDDMFQPLSIIRKGFRSVLDPGAIVYDIWPKRAGAEFQRKVRTLAGNYQLFRLAPWTLTAQNRVLLQLLSHKVMRLIAPYLIALLLLAALTMSPFSRFYAFFAALQVLSLGLALAGLRFRIPVLGTLCGPASALLLLNVAAVVALYKFLVIRGSLWKIWTTDKVKLPIPSTIIEQVTSLDPSAQAAPVLDSPALCRDLERAAEVRSS